MKSVIFATALLPALSMAAPVPDPGVSSIKVVGGQEAAPSEFPFIVSLESKTEGGHFCGGTLLNAKTILTAAHCLDGQNAEDLQIRAGHQKRNTDGTVVDVASLWMHPEYNATTAQNDIALMELAEPIEKGKGISYASLAPPNSDPRAGLNVTIAGWGHTSEGGELANDLKKASFPVIGREECGGLLKEVEITDDMFCAGDLKGGVDSCQGDSGGPIINNENGNVIGAVSFGMGCANANSPGVYARVGHFREQLNEEMAAWAPAQRKRFWF